MTTVTQTPNSGYRTRPGNTRRHPPTHAHQSNRSIAMAVASPPPMQMAATPRRRP